MTNWHNLSYTITAQDGTVKSGLIEIPGSSPDAAAAVTADMFQRQHPGASVTVTPEAP